MWSHYTDSHKGACFQIDTRKLQQKYRDNIQNVRYLDEYPQVSIVPRETDYFRILTRKAKCWKYEKEWRAFSHKEGTLSICVKAISGVILGCMISRDREKGVKSWLKGRHAPFHVYRAIKKKHQYGMDTIEE